MNNVIVFASMATIPLLIHPHPFKPLVVVSQIADYLFIVHISQSSSI